MRRSIQFSLNTSTRDKGSDLTMYDVRCCAVTRSHLGPNSQRSSLRKSDNYAGSQRVELTRYVGKFKLNLLPIRGYDQIKCFPIKWIWTYFCCSHNYKVSYL